MSSVFDSFTNKYSLSKTLRFELIPIGNTQRMLQENKVFQIDESRKDAYEKTKPYLDRLHREFIIEALKEVQLKGIVEYSETLKEFMSDKKDKPLQNQIKEQRKKLREQVVSFFDVEGKRWAREKYSHLKIKKKDLEILFEEQIFGILKDRFGNEKETKLVNKESGEIVSIFDGWKGFTGYFTKFFETRRNFYKSDGTSTALATRIIDQNLDRFLDNIETFRLIKNKIDPTEVENSFKFKSGDVFSTDFYNKCLLQDGIDTYNDFLGGQVLDNGEKIKGINELINKYRQDNKGEKMPFLKKLEKQILSGKEKFIDEIDSPEKFLEVLSSFHESAISKTKVIRTLLSDFLKHSEKYNLSGIFLSKEALNTIAYKWTNDPDSFNENLYLTLKGKRIISSSAKKKDGDYSFPEFISLELVKESLTQKNSEIRFWKDRFYEERSGTTTINVSTELWQQFLNIFELEFEAHFKRIITSNQTGTMHEEGYDFFEPRLRDLLNDLNISQDSKAIIKDFADEVLHIYQMAKYFALEKKRAWVGDNYDLDSEFYHHSDYGFKDNFYENAYEEIVQPYNKIRNYLTKKPYSEEKWKLNFGNPTLANGWDKNKEADNTAIILRKDHKYYLGVMKKGKNQIFVDRNRSQFQSDKNNDYYEKLVYKLFPDPSKMMPKVCFSMKGLEYFKPSEEILRIYQDKEFKKGDTFSVKSMQQLIAFYIECLSSYGGWKNYEFKFLKSPHEYKGNIGEFYADVSKSGYKLWFENVSDEYIHEKNQSGDLFLFQIYNKDFSNKATGKKNLHTLYFEELFSQANIDSNFAFKLNGQAELFYRPKSLESVEEKRNFIRKIVNKKRYTEDKIFFHVPITLNRVPDGEYRFNVELNDFLAKTNNINVIGIDRGEKHLVYYSVIDARGKILESGSLNTINKVDYHQKLESKAEAREQSRRDWQDVEGIKDLKIGYISQVVRKIADLAIKHNAIIVMEDLNMRFKQIRGGIEKSAYQQLEKALIEKLCFLVNKNETQSKKAGHLLNAYQLTAPFETFKDMGKQTGVIFYTQAAYTSKIDPLTGWRPNIYLKYSNASQAKADILKFTDIRFNLEKDRFEFTYDIKDFSTAKEFPDKTVWTICSNVERFRWDRKLNGNKGGYVHYKDMTQELKALVLEFKIDISSDLKEQMKNIDTEKKENIKFFRDLVFYFGLICQIRNTQQELEGNENDFILSPVEPFFDSRKHKDFGEDLPQNGDDNGAYNIARKGIIILQRISEYSKKFGNTDKLSWADLFISNTEWDNFSSPN
jgi:hypothetical protein